MKKKEHLSEEGLEKIKIIKKFLNKTTLEPPVAILYICSSSNTTKISSHTSGEKYNSVFKIGLNSDILTTNLILILKDQAIRPSIYKEVYKILKSKPILLQNLYDTEKKLFCVRSTMDPYLALRTPGGPDPAGCAKTSGEKWEDKDICLANPEPEALWKRLGKEAVQKNLEELIESIKN